MSTENLQEIMASYQKELEKCYEIANLLDSSNPELKGAFIGTPSERIKRQLEYYQVQGFKVPYHE